MTTYEAAVADIREQYAKLLAERSWLRGEGSRQIEAAPDDVRSWATALVRLGDAVAGHASVHYGVTLLAWEFPDKAAADRATWQQIKVLAGMVKDKIDELERDNMRVTHAGAQAVPGQTPWQGEAGATYRAQMARQRKAFAALEELALRAATLAHEASNSFRAVLQNLRIVLLAEAVWGVALFKGARSLVKSGLSDGTKKELAAAVGAKLGSLVVAEYGLETSITQFVNNVRFHATWVEGVLKAHPELASWPDPLSVLPRPVRGPDGRLRVEVPQGAKAG